MKVLKLRSIPDELKKLVELALLAGVENQKAQDNLRKKFQELNLNNVIFEFNEKGSVISALDMLLLSFQERQEIEFNQKNLILKLSLVN